MATPRVPATPIDISDGGIAEPTPAAPGPIGRVPLYVASHPGMARPQSAGTATISMPMKERKVPNLKVVSDGTLSGSVHCPSGRSGAGAHPRAGRCCMRNVVTVRHHIVE